MFFLFLYIGRYHPIAGNTIPETTLLFYAPKSEEEVDELWKIIKKSYEWVSDTKM
jgi:hypothetical protein